MKKIVTVIALLGLVFCAVGCAQKSGLTGKVVDTKGKPVASIKVVAQMEQPVKGYEKFEANTAQDGVFHFQQLYPKSKYTLKIVTDKWTTDTSLTIQSGASGEIINLKNPIVIEVAFSKKNGSIVIDLATGATRFDISDQKVIKDSQTGLEWYLGPNADTDWQGASSWATNLADAGGGWRMPSRAELKGIFLPDYKAEYKIDPIFHLKVCCVWAEEEDGPKSAWNFGFTLGDEAANPRYVTSSRRALAVRSPK